MLSWAEAGVRTLVLTPEGVEEGDEEVEGDGQVEGDAHPQCHVTTEPVQQAARWQHRTVRTTVGQ